MEKVIERSTAGAYLKSFYRRTIAGVAIERIELDASDEIANTATQYLHKDLQGSLDVITDSNGQVAEDKSGNKLVYSFDAWGKRRNALSWEQIAGAPQNTVNSLAVGAFNLQTSNRGYTGHEMLDEVGLIHMNGRIYDPRLGRFMQADPFVDGNFNTQGYNRYSYGKNSPLSGVDPSGYGFFSEVFDDILGITESPILNAVAQIAACVYGGPGGCAAYATASARGHGASWNAAIKAGAIAYVSSSAFRGISGGYEAGFITLGEAVFYSGVVGGTMSVLQGGKFGHGFAAAGLGTAGGSIPGLDGKSFEAISRRVIVGAVVGGTASKITGGKFANGAATAAFAAIVSSIGQKETPVNADGSPAGGVPQGDYEAVEEHLAKALGIDENYTVVDKSQSAIAKHTGNGNTHGTVVNLGKGNYEVWIDRGLKGTDYWTIRYHEIRHVWQKANGLTQYARYPSSYASGKYISNLVEYDAWRYTKYVGNHYNVSLTNSWISERLGHHATQYYNSPHSPPLEISCCGGN